MVSWLATRPHRGQLGRRFDGPQLLAGRYARARGGQVDRIHRFVSGFAALHEIAPKNGAAKLLKPSSVTRRASHAPRGMPLVQRILTLAAGERAAHSGRGTIPSGWSSRTAGVDG
jgi:hypothetical protein